MHSFLWPTWCQLCVCRRAVRVAWGMMYAMRGGAVRCLAACCAECAAMMHAVRSAWGMMYGLARIFIAKAQAHLPRAPPPARLFLLRWLIALPYLMRGQLAETRGPDGLRNLLTPSEARRPPLFPCYAANALTSTPTACSARPPGRVLPCNLARASPSQRGLPSGSQVCGRLLCRDRHM